MLAFPREADPPGRPRRQNQEDPLLDSITLRVTLGVVTLILFLLFALATYRSTKSAFSFWWCTALVLFMGGTLGYLQDGTAHQASPAAAHRVGNARGCGGC
jgi:hypothetical protein